MPMVLKTDREHQAYQEGLKKPHKTSPETRNLITNMEDKFDKKFEHLKDKVTDFETKITKSLGDVKLEIIEAMNENMKEMAKECDKKYAPMSYANALKFFMGAVASALIMAGMALILK